MSKTLKRPPSPVNPANPESHLLPIMPIDRRARGKRLRDAVPRDAHAAWRAHAGRPDPISILRAADATRQPDLVPLRYGRMLQSPFTFYRGSAGVMAADLAPTPATGIRVQACGDAHLLNFGGFATPERRLIFDINDLDETLPAPWEWDLKRLVHFLRSGGPRQWTLRPRRPRGGGRLRRQLPARHAGIHRNGRPGYLVRPAG